MVTKLTFHNRLYLSESIAEKKLDKLKKRLERKPLLASVYIIVPAANPVDQLEIFDARQLVQPFFQKEHFLVIGIAADYKDALQLIEKMVQDCLAERGDCNLREYFVC